MLICFCHGTEDVGYVIDRLQLTRVKNKTRGNDESFPPKLTELINILRRFPILVLNSSLFFFNFKIASG